jgi:hypothetical protein
MAAKDLDAESSSVFSQETEAERWTLIAKGQTVEDGGGGKKRAVGNSQFDAEADLKRRVIHCINNIEEASDKIASYNPNRSDFFKMLSEVSRDKVQAIREAKIIFQEKLRKVSQACNYEISSQEAICILAAQTIFSH